MNIVEVLALFTPIFSIVGSFYLLYRARTMQPDLQWQRHFERQQALGLHPIRTVQWERDLRRGRWISALAGCVLLTQGIVMAWFFWRPPIIIW